MNRNLSAKRKCNSTPGAVSGPAMPRAQECSQAALDKQIETVSERIPIKTRVIVSISGDMEFDRRLRVLAMQSGLIVIRVESMEDALRVVRSDCCGIILLDLDSLGRNALEMAGDLLRDALCPPVILLTGKGEQFDLRMTVFAGSVLEKSTDTHRILNLLKAILKGWCAGPEQFPSQGGVARWEESDDGPVPRAPANRFWGIND